MRTAKRKKARYEFAQEVVAGIKEKAGVHEDAKSTAQRTVGQSVKQSWDCSQIESEEDKEEEDWQKEGQMDVQWAEDEKLEESLDRRRMEGSSLQAEVMRKVPELVVHERMSQGEGVHCTKEKKKVKGWSAEEMKGKPSSSLEIDTEEMIKRRGLRQDEVGRCWKNLAAKWKGRSWTSTRPRTAKERLAEVETTRWNGGVCVEAGSTGRESGGKIAVQESSPCSENATCSVCNASRRSQRKEQRMKNMKDLTK